MTQDKTAMMIMVKYLDGLLKIEDNIIVQYGDNPKAVDDIKRNWQQLNMIKTKATELLAVEKETIYNAFVAGLESGTCETPFNCEQYYNQNYKQQP